MKPTYWTQEQIATYLNNRGQTTLRGRPWTQASVSAALRATNRGL